MFRLTTFMVGTSVAWFLLYQFYRYITARMFPVCVSRFLDPEEWLIPFGDPLPEPKPADRAFAGMCAGVITSLASFRLYNRMHGSYTDLLSEEKLRRMSVAELRYFSLTFSRGKRFGAILVAAILGGFVNGAIDNKGPVYKHRKLGDSNYPDL